MFKNKKSSIMNPENPNSPFFKNNVLKQGTVLNNTCDDYDDYYDDCSLTPTSKKFASINNIDSIDDSYDDYTDSKVCSSTYWEDDSTSSSSYDYNEEFNYNYSYNGYESDNYGYDAYDNDIYDNFDCGLYDLYENNTFNDY